MSLARSFLAFFCALSTFKVGAVVAGPIVNVSVEPVALVVREICADQCEVFTLVPKGASEHSWQPSPKEMVRAKQASASIAIGLGFDDLWFKKLELMPRSVLKIGEKLSPMAWWSDDMSGSQGKNVASDKANQKRTHDHSHGGADHSHNVLTNDPHVWTDAGRMAIAAEFIANHLAQQIPEASKNFLERSKLIAERLTKLQLDTDARRKGWRARPVVMFHDTAGYFARRFNLPVLSVAPGATGHELSAKMIAKVAQKFKSASIAAVMVEKSDGAAKSLAKELKTQVKVVDFAANQSYKLWDDWYLHLVSSWESVLQ